MTKTKIPLDRAENLAQRIAAELAPGCARIEVAGSIRRRVPWVGDIEIVAIPEYDIAPIAQLSMLDERPCAMVSLLDNEIERLLSDKPHFRRGDKNGEKFKNFVINDQIKLDLFITTRPQWGIIYAIRTGPAEFSRRLVMSRAAQGLLPPEYQVREGWLWCKGEKVPTPSERDVFDVIGQWVAPEARTWAFR